MQNLKTFKNVNIEKRRYGLADYCAFTLRRRKKRIPIRVDVNWWLFLKMTIPFKVRQIDDDVANHKHCHKKYGKLFCINS